MEIRYIETIGSTHNALCEAIRNKEIIKNIALYSRFQTNGIGSRGNIWESEDGNLFFSFCMQTEKLPKDLPQNSISIYFAWIILEFLRLKGSRVWLKWPNDFYIENKKIGGIITTKIDNFIIVSAGINFKKSKYEFEVIDIAITPKIFVDDFTPLLDTLLPWKHIFSKYKVEFCFSKKFYVHIDGKMVPLEKAKLNEDGSIEIENKKVYSLR